MPGRIVVMQFWRSLAMVPDLAVPPAPVVLSLTVFVLLNWFCLATLTTATEDTAGSDSEQNSFISFKIKDQFDHLHTDARYRGSVIVVTWADRKGSDYMDNWGPVLNDSLALELRSFRVRQIDVAHVKGVPFFIKGKIKGYFSKDPGERVLMDWDGEFDKAYDCTKDHSNVLVFARDGELSGRWAVTESDSTALTEMLGLIRHLTAP